MIDNLLLFIDIVEMGQLSQVAKARKLSKSQVSRQLAKLEQSLNTRLLNRNTRHIALTEAGKTFYQHALSMKALWEEALGSVQADTAELAGEMNMTAPVAWGGIVIAPLLAEFSIANPHVRLNLDLSSQLFRLNRPVDLAVREAVQLSDSSLVAKRLCQFEFVLCASESYLQSHSVLRSPEDLTTHRCITSLAPDATPRWDFVEGGETLSVIPSGVVSVGSYDAQLRMVEQGCGIARVPLRLAKQALDQGLVQAVLSEYNLQVSTLWLLHPYQHALPVRVRALMDFLIEKISV